MWMLFFMSLLSVILLVLAAATAAFAQDSSLSEQFPVVIGKYESH